MDRVEIDAEICQLGFGPQEESLYQKLFDSYHHLELDTCFAILANATFSPVVQQNPAIYPGAYTDIEHALLLQSHRMIFIDPAYEHQAVIDKISDKMNGLGIEIQKRQKKVRNIAWPFERIIYSLDSQYRCIDAYAEDFFDFFTNKSIVAKNTGAYLIKNPNVNRLLGTRSLYQIAEEDYRSQNISKIKSGGMYIEAGIPDKIPDSMAGKLDLLFKGLTLCTVFGRDDEESLYETRVYSVK